MTWSFSGAALEWNAEREMESPWDTIERLENRAAESDFPLRWRTFVKSCAGEVVQHLPKEAEGWLDASRDFDRGDRSAEEMANEAERAWAFYRARADTDRWGVQNGLLVVMTAIGTEFDPTRWHEQAWHFLNCCEAAGIPDERLAGLLETAFGTR